MSNVRGDYAAVASHVLAASKQKYLPSSGAASLSLFNCEPRINLFPPSRCFSDRNLSSPLNFETALRLSLLGWEVENSDHNNNNRMQHLLPTSNDVTLLTQFVDNVLEGVKSRPFVKKLCSSSSSSSNQLLTDDDIRALILINIGEAPYPFSQWLNGWLMNLGQSSSSSRETSEANVRIIKKNIGPIFTFIYRAMEKLPKVVSSATSTVVSHRSASSEQQPLDRSVVIAKGVKLNFLGFAGFTSTASPFAKIAGDDDNDDDDGRGSGGSTSIDSIVYECDELEGVNIEPFAPDRDVAEEAQELVPLCPALFEVIRTRRSGRSLIVTLEQQSSDAHRQSAYVDPK